MVSASLQLLKLKHLKTITVFQDLEFTAVDVTSLDDVQVFRLQPANAITTSPITSITETLNAANQSAHRKTPFSYLWRWINEFCNSRTSVHCPWWRQGRVLVRGWFKRLDILQAKSHSLTFQTLYSGFLKFRVEDLPKINMPIEVPDTQYFSAFVRHEGSFEIYRVGTTKTRFYALKLKRNVRF